MTNQKKRRTKRVSIMATYLLALILIGNSYGAGAEYLEIDFQIKRCAKGVEGSCFTNEAELNIEKKLNVPITRMLSRDQKNGESVKLEIDKDTSLLVETGPIVNEKQIAKYKLKEKCWVFVSIELVRSGKCLFSSLTPMCAMNGQYLVDVFSADENKRYEIRYGLHP